MPYDPLGGHPFDMFRATDMYESAGPSTSTFPQAPTLSVRTLVSLQRPPSGVNSADPSDGSGRHPTGIVRSSRPGSASIVKSPTDPVLRLLANQIPPARPHGREVRRRLPHNPVSSASLHLCFPRSTAKVDAHSPRLQPLLPRKRATVANAALQRQA